jgi:hypothetical protein
MRITIIYKYEPGDTIKTTTGLNQELVSVFTRFGYRIMKGGSKKGRSYLVFSNETGDTEGLRGLNLNDL